jgi:delta1-piperideine-2-carboxylate reductase
MSEQSQVNISEIQPLCMQILTRAGYDSVHAEAIAKNLLTCQIDDCQSHGIFRLFMCTRTIKAGKIDGHARPLVAQSDNAIVQADARGGISLPAFEAALPLLIEKSRRYGISAMAINHCYHFSALWPEVEQLSAAGLVAMAMLPNHSRVAPAGGRRGTLGTNPFAFSWPRFGKDPFTFDFATSIFARGEIELYARANKPLPDGVALDKNGNPTNDPRAALDGVLLTFGGFKGSALSIMIELLAGPLIDDLISLESMELSDGTGGAPYHGEIILAFDPVHFNKNRQAENDTRAERLFADIIDQGARLPSQRRYAARARNLDRGYVTVARSLYEDLQTLL